MQCTLCKQEIKHYDARFSHIVINDNTAVDLCEDCIDKIRKAEQQRIASLVPTKQLKKVRK